MLPLFFSQTFSFLNNCDMLVIWYDIDQCARLTVKGAGKWRYTQDEGNIDVYGQWVGSQCGLCHWAIWKNGCVMIFGFL